MSGSVKDLIRNIRGCKTASEEKAVLARECAKIRSSLTNDNITSRRKNITKLLFIHLLGHPTNFGQVECIKLIASSKFSDKRIGYLALNVLLTEDSEVLMLATNSIKIDLNDPNPYVCEMALRSLANIGTNEMLRELQYEIERLMNSNVPNIKKKATICTIRMLRKEANRNLTPDSVSMELAKSFLKYLGPLISDYDNGVKTSGLSLMAVFLEHYTEICNLPEFFQLLLTTMSSLLTQTNTNFSSTIPSTTEQYTGQNLFDEQGSSDPFLKVKLLSLIKQVYHKLLSNKTQTLDGLSNRDLLGNTNDFDMSLVGYKQQLYDLVSKIINTIEMGTNSNYAILYECLTAIESELVDEKFNDLGKMVVDKFIQGPTNNIKYLALGVIKRLHNLQLKQGDSIWCIILQSFKQKDLSIRMKALDVSLKVVNSTTLKPLMQYLYEFLLSVDEDLRKESLHRIFNCVNQHSDDLEYKLNVFVKIFTIAGNSVQDVILFDFIDLLASSSQQQKVNTTVELLKVVRYNMGQSALVKSSLYSVGEYYELLSNVKLKNVLGTYSPYNSNSRNTNDVVYNDNKDYKNSIGNMNNDTSIDLLLDLSTPTNRTSSRPNNQSNEFDKPREDDLLLDLQSPNNMATEPSGLGGSSDNELFDLYNFETETQSNQTNTNNNNRKTTLDNLSTLNTLDNNDTSHDLGERDLDDDLAVVELIENICIRLLTKNLLNECEFLITCIGKLVYKMPKGSEHLRKILRKFKRHSNPELQQRACELDVLIQENMVSVINPSSKGVLYTFSSSDKDLSSLYLDSELDKNKDKLTQKEVEYSNNNNKDNELVSLYDEKLVISGNNYNSSNLVKDLDYDKKDSKTVTDDLFDEFFNSNNNKDDNDNNERRYTSVNDLENTVDRTNILETANQNIDYSQLTNINLVNDLNFNNDKLTNNIVENVAIVSSRDKKEDDFQQFDPF